VPPDDPVDGLERAVDVAESAERRAPAGSAQAWLVVAGTSRSVLSQMKSLLL
jgi:hypothetical protein